MAGISFLDYCMGLVDVFKIYEEIGLLLFADWSFAICTTLLFYSWKLPIYLGTFSSSNAFVYFCGDLPWKWGDGTVYYSFPNFPLVEIY